MFHAIVVDDESAALKRFERIAAEHSGICVDGAFLYAQDALSFVRENPVDVAFLDIEMPEMSGLELAERLMDIDPCIRVVFITAYNQYALDAFRAHAIGYLLKPLGGGEFAEQIDHLARRYRERPGGHPNNRRLSVKCFGQFSVSAAENGAPAIRWKTAKAEELFALLIHHQGRVKSKESLIDALWPELDPKKSANLFRVTCTYLRTALADLGFPKLLLRELDGYKINAGQLDCDLFRLRSMDPLMPMETERLEEISALYCGEYLEGKPYDWAVAAKAQLESDFKRVQYGLADRYFAVGSIEKACAAMEKVMLYDPCEEEAVMRIIRIKLQAGDHTHAARVYRGYAKMLKDEFGIAPSEKFQRLFSRGTT